MLKLVIADDKPSTREGLRKNLPWSEDGIDVVAVTADGRETLDACMAHRPDMLVTDIKMPFLSGLDVARTLRERGVFTRTIIISGIADFEYARDAVELHADGYLLKPLRLDELRALVQRTAERIHTERREREDLAELRVRFQESLPILRSAFLRDILSGTPPAGATIRKADDVAGELTALGWALDSQQPATVAVAQIDDYDSLAARLPSDRRHVLQLSFERLLSRSIGTLPGEVVRMRENELALLVNTEREEELAKALQRAQATCGELLEVRFSAGLGRPAQTLLQLRRGYREACTAIQHRFHTGTNAIIDYQSLVPDTQEYDDESNEEIQEAILSSVIVGEGERVRRMTQELFQRHADRVEYGLARARAAAAQLVVRAHQSLLDASDTSDLGAVLPAIFHQNSLYELKEYTDGALAAIADRFSRRYSDQASELVGRVRAYVQQHFAENVGIREVARAVNYSPNYMSLVFHRATGMTAKEYLTGVRIDHGKKLLRTTKLPVFEVARECGFQNAQYFSTVFRKVAGVTPRQFRDEPPRPESEG